jgi:glycosyltransferase involved in cell wall biosynthesis
MIDLCVVSYNTKEKLQRLIETLASDYDSNIFNLYIFDNNSTDGTKEYINDSIRNLGWQGSVIDSNFNYGYAYACNFLASESRSDVIGLLNADVWLRSRDVARIEERMIELNTDILGPKQRDEDGNITHAGIFGSNTEPQHRAWKVSDPDDTLFRDSLNAVTVSGSAYFVNRLTWENLGNDDEYLALLQHLVEKNCIPTWSSSIRGAFLPTPHYYEETWCSYFARHRGYNIMYDGEVSIGHSWHASSEIGGEPDSKFKISQAIFRESCDFMGIEHD